MSNWTPEVFVYLFLAAAVGLLGGFILRAAIGRRHKQDADGAIDQRDTDLAGLEAKLREMKAEHQTALTEADSRNRKAEGRIQGLHLQLAESGEVEDRLHASVAERDVTIGELEERITRLVAERNAAMERLREHIAALGQAREDAAAERDGYAAQLLAADSTIAELRAQLAVPEEAGSPMPFAEAAAAGAGAAGLGVAFRHGRFEEAGLPVPDGRPSSDGEARRPAGIVWDDPIDVMRDELARALVGMRELERGHADLQSRVTTIEQATRRQVDSPTGASGSHYQTLLSAKDAEIDALRKTIQAFTQTPDREEVARVAYGYAEARGFVGGTPEEDWLRAESAVRTQMVDARRRLLKQFGRL